MPAPKPAASSTRTPIRTLNLDQNMAVSTPSVRAATLAEMTPVATTPPAANRLAALIVEINNKVGTQADAASCERIAASDPLDSTKPRRARRLANRVLALDSRPESVPWDQ